MRLTRITTALLALGAFSVWGNGYAADKFDFGKHEFESHCVVCHGWEGKGDGPFAHFELLKIKIPDLTTLSRKNNGVFPLQRVYEVIDGTEALKAHGTREMPIWGTVYTAEVEEAYFDVPFNPRAYVRLHILALIDYISRLQAK
jgi:hypothetical protein